MQVPRGVADPRRQTWVAQTPVLDERRLRYARAQGRLVYLARDVVLYSTLEEFEKLRSKHFVLRARKIDGGRGIVLCWRDWGKELLQGPFHTRRKS
jgi:hypothetical protein